MEYFDLWDSCMIKSLRLPKSGNQLRFLIHWVHALMESILEDKDAMDKGVVDKLNKRKPDDAKRDEDPPAGLDQGLKRKKTSKDVEPSKKETVFEAGDSQMPQDLGKDMSKTDEPPSVKADLKNCELSKAEKPSKTFNELMSNPIDFIAFAMNRRHISDLTKANLVRPVYNLLKGTCKGYVELEYNMEECYKALNDQLDWNNPKGDRYPFDLSKPLPLVESRNRLIVPAEYFFNKIGNTSRRKQPDRTYTTSLTNTKVAKYDLKGIEDMVPTLWSHVKVAYNKHATLVWVNSSGRGDMADTILELGYNSVMPRRRWSNLDKKRSRIMVKDIDRQLLERRLMRSLENFVCGREYGENLRLLQRII
ncbi:hypothetical protein Tco_1437463 [Tanacetum coccineum]